MFFNYIKIAWRNIWKSKITTSINVIGLSVAIAAALLLGLTAAFEFSYDNFHEKNDRLFQAYWHTQQPNGRTEEGSNMMMPLGPAILNEIPEVEAITRYQSAGGALRIGNDEFNATTMAVDPGFFKMFSFPIVNGDTKNPLSQQSNIVVTELAAKKYVKAGNPIGKQVDINMNGQWKTFIISAVTKDFPENSTVKYDFLVPFEGNAYAWEQSKDNWGSSNHELFFMLKPNTTIASFEKHAVTLVNKYFASTIEQLKKDGAVPGAKGHIMELRGMPFPEVHFSNVSQSGGGAKTTVIYLLLAIAGFLMLIACINFVNLTVGRSFTRAKEIGVRKILGAYKTQLFAQLWGEAFIVSFMAFLLGLLLCGSFYSTYAAMFNTQLSIFQLFTPTVIVWVVISFVVVTLLAGGYPALVMIRLNTIEVMKGKLKTSRKNYFRNSLIVVQFVFSTLLITCTVIAYQQLTYLRNRPLGIDKGTVISVPMDPTTDDARFMHLFRNKLEGNAAVVSVSAADQNFGRGRDGSSGTSKVGFTYEGRALKAHWQTTNFDFVKTMGLQLIAGRDFSKAFNDSNSIVINEAMAKTIGKKDLIGLALPVDSARPLTIIGIVKDYNFKSLHQKIEPIIMQMMEGEEHLGYAFVKIQPNQLVNGMNAVEAAWKEIVPGKPFLGSFLDENLAKQYKREERLSQIFVVGAILTIILSCMGLFAISLLVIAQRTKEIGIRKVLGASVSGVVVLLSVDFLKLVLLGIIIAAPVAIIFMSSWLEDFAYHVNITWYTIAAVVIISLGIAFLTVCYQSIRAALLNPVKSLKTE
ncbi:ABC-type antimicrobial peptide transport system permease subunit [Chitinophaga skermanii]|uniref:ABC-type antimicrobial peptide transport system permease subunit n=1 Tax=Chitinophaga skermanii TaxID=331697 RepID=A0A327QHK2_9BACT|nr:ABC transporter permease [Chitinophaga skermanii]RAJ03890.1 ABC-type antimicrobial peptide transport system permease subunit [Chitinophaga skermanii]